MSQRGGGGYFAPLKFYPLFWLKWAKIWLNMTIGDHLEAFDQCPTLGADI